MSDLEAINTQATEMDRQGHLWSGKPAHWFFEAAVLLRRVAQAQASETPTAPLTAALTDHANLFDAEADTYGNPERFVTASAQLRAAANALTTVTVPDRDDIAKILAWRDRFAWGTCSAEDKDGYRETADHVITLMRGEKPAALLSGTAGI